ncbi:protocadherin alpha-10-like [Seriola lalandi dorsalis]|uniref:protocadherin alpha-10-like n=1 Tax=Seriola lalandi dorsalis TaxID=1841481 RepID=UPI000C6F9D5E|nr:protocadherin alpha-10-like [Seriola lalandi dorsalis]
MEKSGRQAWNERWTCIAYMVLLVTFWNEASAQIRYSISEEVKEGSIVGHIAKDLGIDKATLKDREYRIVGSSTEPLFHLNKDDGILYVNRKVDREEICERSNACVINLKTVLENPLEIHYVAIEVLDINDHSPIFPEKEKRLEIFESTLPGARFQLQPARDPDGGQFSVQQYKLSQNDHFRLEVKERGEDRKMPFLILQKQLDREAKREHKLLLSAIDGGRPAKSGTIEILIEVLDVNDNSPVFTQDVYSATLNENAAPVGTMVIQVNATDLDDGLNGEVFYSFGSNVNGKLRKLFDIDETTGEITVKGLIDFEQKDRYEIDIKASDKGTVPLKTDKSVIINVVDLNDNIPEIEVTSFSSAIPEDSKPGTTVALISVSDLDSGLNGKVICFIRENVPFTLNPSLQDNMYSVVTKSSLDREHQSHYDVTVVAKDGGDSALSSEKTISVDVSDVNDNSPEFSLSPYTFYVTESNTPGASLFSVRASDCDENENALISYHIIRGGTEDKKLTSFLNINSDNGDILALKSFDFETLKTFQFQVSASDSGTPSLSSNVTVNVFILDQNDNAPVILYPLSSNGSAEGVEEIPRNVNAGHLVTKVRAYDADIGYNGWLLFSLQEVTDHSLFGLDRYTGRIRTLRSFTETDEAEHKLVILVKDNGNVSLSATATVIVKLVEPKEAFAASDVKSSAKADEENNVTFYLMITLGSVSALFLISITVLIAMQCSKSTDYTSKYLQETNYDGTLCHSIQYRSGDKRYMLVGPRMSIGSTIVPGSHANTLVLPDRRRTSEEFKVQATDSGVLPLSSNVTVNVFILDENDNSPAVLVPYSEHGSVNSESIPYSAEAGYFVAKIRAVDADSGYNALLSYHLSEPKGNNLFRIGTSNGEIRTKRRMSDNDLKTHSLVVLVSDNGEPSLSATVSIEVVVVESTADIQTQFRHVPIKEDSFSDLNLYLLIAIVSVSVIFLLSLISLIAVKCHRTEGSFSRYSAPMITTHPDGSWSYSKATQQYDVCFSSDTLKSDVVVFPAPFPPVDAELISINGGDTFTRTQTLPNNDKYAS